MTSPEFPPPVLGPSVHDVILAFRDRSLEWAGLRVIEATLVFNSRSQQMRFRWQRDGLHVVVTNMGLIRSDGAVATRPATTEDHQEFEDGLAAGMVQIAEFDRMKHELRVLHQATLRPLPIESPDLPVLQDEAGADDHQRERMAY